MMMFPNDTEYIDLLDPARAAKLPTNHISARFALQVYCKYNF